MNPQDAKTHSVDVSMWAMSVACLWGHSNSRMRRRRRLTGRSESMHAGLGLGYLRCVKVRVEDGEDWYNARREIGRLPSAHLMCIGAIQEYKGCPLIYPTT